VGDGQLSGISVHLSFRSDLKINVNAIAPYKIATCFHMLEGCWAFQLQTGKNIWTRSMANSLSIFPFCILWSRSFVATKSGEKNSVRWNVCALNTHGTESVRNI
jgi:hypothetical protein